MGLSFSKRVEDAVSSSTAFSSACDSTFDLSLSLAQHSSPLLRLYQLPSAAVRLHRDLSPLLPLLPRWAPLPPSPADVDAALRRLQALEASPLADGLSRAQFRAFALDLLRAVLLRGATRGAARALAAGALGIAGLSAAVSAPRAAAAAAVGVYAAGAAVAVYLGLG